MIIKFDHLTYVDVRDNFHLDDNYSADILFKEMELINPHGKKKFMTYPHHDSTVIYVQKQRPIEYVLYDSVAGKSPLIVEGNIISSKVKKETVGIVSDFFTECIRAKMLHQSKEAQIYNLRGVFDNYDTLLRLEIVEDVSENYRVWLDWSGWQCPCMMVDNIESIITVMKKCTGIDYSLDVLKVNGRNLKICFIQIDGLEVILELIAPGD